MKELNINVFSEDAHFCSALAIECNKYGFDLNFFEYKNIRKIIESDQLSVFIIDLKLNDYFDPYLIAKEIRSLSDFPMFGISDNKIIKNQVKVKECGFDLVFSKTILLRSIKEVIIHIKDQ